MTDRLPLKGQLILIPRVLWRTMFPQCLEELSYKQIHAQITTSRMLTCLFQYIQAIQ